MKKKKTGIPTRYTITFAFVALILAFNIYAFVNSERNSDIIEDTAPVSVQTPENASDEPSPLPSAQASQTQSPQPEKTPVIPEVPETNISFISLTEPELVVILDAVAIKYNCAAVSLAVFDGEYNYFTYQYGHSDIEAGQRTDEDTKFRVASLSKLVAAICAMTLVDSGQIDLDVDISQYLGYKVRNPSYPSIPITCRMLLSHTSSLFDSEDFLASRAGNSTKSTKQLLDGGESYLKRKPGEKHEYSNLGIAVLGNVCEKVYGKNIDSLAREILFAPLGIDAAFTPANLHDTGKIAVIYNENHKTTRTVQSQVDIGTSDELGRDHHLTQGNLTISALDYARILAMLTNGGALDGVRILSEESAAEIHEPVISTNAYEQGLTVRFKDDVFLGEAVYWHTGSAYGELTEFIYDKQSGYGVVAITTGAKSDREANGMVKVCNELIEVVWKQVRKGNELPLSGMKVCIDPGHQRRADTSHEPIAPGASESKPKVASGTTGVKTKITEYELTMTVGKALREKLESLGAEIIMTRTMNTGNISNSQRAILANEHNCDMVVRIHADGSENPNTRGYSILIPGSLYTPDIVEDSTRMAQILDNMLMKYVSIPSRGIITRDDLTGFNYLTVPGILIEMGYMTNEIDDELMQTEQFQESLNTAIAEALALYYRLSNTRDNNSGEHSSTE